MLKKVFIASALIAGSCAVAVAIGEFGLHAAGISYPSFYRYDDERGAALRPGAEGMWRKENENYVRINSHGLRDVERTYEKPPGAFRIAVLGDSFTEAFQVPLEDIYTSVIERRLSGCPSLGGARVEAINFGVSGYGTAQEYLTLKTEVWKYSPDAVVLAFYAGNDLRNNSYELEKEFVKPYYTFTNGEPVLRQDYRESLGPKSRSLKARIVDRLIDCSRIVQALVFYRETYRVRAEAGERGRDRPDKGDNRNEEEREKRAKAINDKIFVDPEEKEWRETWNVTERLIEMIHDEVAAHGALFFMVTLSVPAQVDPSSERREAHTARLNVDDLFYTERRLAALAEKTGFPLLALAPAMQRYADKNGVYLHGFGGKKGVGHWNREGNRVAGEATARWLCEHL